MQNKLFVEDSDGEVIAKYTPEGTEVPTPKSAYEIRVEEFEKEWRYGSTHVFKENGQYYWCGDIEHCPFSDLFFNATKMKKLLMEKGGTEARMNYNDPPTFGSFSRADFDKDQNCYKYDIYTWNGDEPILVKSYFEKPQKQIYCLESDEEEDESE